MIISTKGRYALRVMVDLAENHTKTYTPMKEVARREGISLKYLEKILPVLTRHGLIDVLHGKGGGYKLNRAPEDYILDEILCLAEGDLAPVSCVECGAVPCQRAEICRARPIWMELDRRIHEYLSGITLADLLCPDPDQAPQTDTSLSQKSYEND